MDVAPTSNDVRPLRNECAIVLVRTRSPGNIGAVARAMANFGVIDLRLVEPFADPLCSEARALASHGEQVLLNARRYPSLSDAVADCTWVACTSARLGGLFRKQNVLHVREAMPLAAGYAVQGRIALVFGPEDHGLLNEEVSLCHQLIHIPAHHDYPVLNLAQAVVVCLYEWFQVSQHQSHRLTTGESVSAGDLARTLDHLEKALRAVHFIWGDKGDSVAHAIRQLLARARPDQQENKLLHGLARQVLWYVEHHPRVHLSSHNENR